MWRFLNVLIVRHVGISENVTYVFLFIGLLLRLAHSAFPLRLVLLRLDPWILSCMLCLFG